MSELKRFFAYWVVTIVFGLIAGVVIGGLHAVTALETYELPNSSPEEISTARAILEAARESDPSLFPLPPRGSVALPDATGREDQQTLSILIEEAKASEEYQYLLPLWDAQNIVRSESQSPEYCSRVVEDYCLRDRASLIGIPVILSFFLALIGFILVRIVYGSFKLVFDKNVER